MARKLMQYIGLVTVLVLVTGLFADVKGYPRFTRIADIPAVMNDQAIRAILTDQKGVNGF